MTIFDELGSQHYEIFDHYSSKEFEASSHGRVRKQKKYRRQNEINDQAYFLFMFTRLEDHIRQQSATLIKRKKKSISSWKQKAAWEILPSDPTADDLSFKKRLALLTEKGGSDYNLVSQYYEERNSIAHGGDFISKINMPNVIYELKRLYKMLRA